MSNKAVVFGGAGFLGGYVVDELCRRGYEVVAADIQQSDYLPKSVFQYCDVLDRESVAKAVTSDVDFVYNFAGLANLDEAVTKPVETIESNVIGNLNILEACKNKKINRFVYASSTYALSNKGSFYGISKLASEKLIEEYYRAFGLNFTIIRYGSVYGERAYGNNYLYNILRDAILNKKIEHDRDGEEVREYIHANDAAKLSVDIIEDVQYNCLNLILTGIERMRRIELFTMVKEILNNEVDIILNNEIDDHHYKITPYSFHPSVSKKLVPNPYTDMGQGILECIKEIHARENGH